MVATPGLKSLIFFNLLGPVRWSRLSEKNMKNIGARGGGASEDNRY